MDFLESCLDPRRRTKCRLTAGRHWEILLARTTWKPFTGIGPCPLSFTDSRRSARLITARLLERSRYSAQLSGTILSPASVARSEFITGVGKRAVSPQSQYVIYYPRFWSLDQQESPYQHLSTATQSATKLYQ